MIRFGCRLFALLSATTLLAGFSAFAQAPRRTLAVWGVSLGRDSKGDQAVIREFQRRHPEIDVKILNLGAGGMNPQKLMTAIIGDVAPDVINQDRFTIADWASRGAFRPLDDLIARDRGKDPYTPVPEQYYPATWEEGCYQGKLYGVPTGGDDRIFYYNKAIFRQREADLRKAGLDPNRPPRTWSELLAYSKVLTEYNRDGSLKMAGFMPNFGNSWLYMYAFQMNASFLSADGRTCTLDTPAAEEALKFMVDGYDLIGGYEKAKAFESGFLAGENDPFLLGKVAMKIDGSWILDNMARYHPEIELGSSPPPTPDDRFYKRGAFANEKDPFITWTGGYAYAIPMGARNVQDAWEYIKFVTSTEGRMLQASAQRQWDRYLGRSYISAVSANIETNKLIMERYPPPDPKFANALKLHMAMVPVGRIRPPTFVGQRLWNSQVRAFEAAAYHQMSPKEALIFSAKPVQEDLDNYFGIEQYPKIDTRIPFGIAGGLALVAIGAVSIWLRKIRLGKIARGEAKWGFILIAPWVIGFLVFTAGPMIASLFFSFTSYDVLNPIRWVGLKNYLDIGGSDKTLVLKALSNSVYLAAVGVPLGLFTGLAIALLLNVARKGIRFYRTFFYMPAIVPGVASAVLWAWVLTPDANKGLVNAMWRETLQPWLGVAPPSWLNSADWSKNALVLMGMWGAGSGMILWLAGLKGVPTTLYEAASIDGANPRRQFWSVTFPMLSPVIFFNTVMGLISAMQEFDRVYVMMPLSDGSVGPDDSLLTPVFHLFVNGFQYFHMGYASALAWMIFAIILVITYGQFKLAPRWVHYEAEK